MIRGHQNARIARARADAFPHQDRMVHSRLAALASIVAMASAAALLSGMASEVGDRGGPSPVPASLINF